MLYEEERKAKIVEYIKKHSSESVQQLAKKFGVSESTIRRDLTELEEAKYIKRTHGGAVKLEVVNYEPSYNEKEVKFAKEKECIAKKAVEFINNGDTILLDSGTTTQFLAKELKQFSHLTIVTNSLMIANELAGLNDIEIIVVGGILRKNTLALAGSIAEEVFKVLRVDKAFIATNGIDLKEGLTTPSVIEAYTKKKMLEISKQVFLLTDHTKVGKVAFVKFGNIEEINYLIIDNKVDKDTVKNIREKEIDVFVVNT
ncbi:MAG: DeoR/GlpR family DNA-binding transcription regulator [Clostridiales bacterium]